MATATATATAATSPAFSIPPPQHPTYDINRVIRAALEEDAGDLGDVTTLAT